MTGGRQQVLAVRRSQEVFPFGCSSMVEQLPPKQCAGSSNLSTRACHIVIMLKMSNISVSIISVINVNDKDVVRNDVHHGLQIRCALIVVVRKIWNLITWILRLKYPIEFGHGLMNDVRENWRNANHSVMIVM